MPMTGLSTFDATVHKTNQVLKDIEAAYGWPKERRNQSYAALRAVLHALRDRLTVQEASDLASQLPILISGLFFQNWNPSKVPMKMRREEFLERVRHDFTFELEGGTEALVKTVFTALSRYVSEGEFEDIRAIVPKDMVDLLPPHTTRPRQTASG